MKHTKHLGLLLLFVIVGCTPAAPLPVATQGQPEMVATIAPTAVSPTETSAGLWEVVLQTEVEQPVRMAAFLDGTFGLTGGADNAGRAHYTSDGGQTWTKATNSSGCLFALDIVDAQTAWECNASDIRLSTDGGQTWQGAPTGRGQPLCQVSALDDKIAWHLDPVKLEVTLDGGATTEEVSLPEGVRPANVLAIALRTPSDGYVLDDTGTLYTTRDGGQSWTSQNVGLQERFGEMEPMPPGGIAPAAMRFLDAEHGVIVMSVLGGGSSKTMALRTADGGQTWTEESVPAEFGTAYLTRDGEFLTIHAYLNSGHITVLRYTGN